MAKKPDLPTTPPVDPFAAGESPADWARLRGILAAARDGDDIGEAQTLLTRMGLSPDLARLLWTAVVEEAELSAIVATAPDPTRLDALVREGRLLAQAKPTTIAEITAIGDRQREISTEYEPLARAAESASLAAQRLVVLRAMLPELFGLPVPPTGPPDGLSPPPRVAQLCHQLGISVYARHVTYSAPGVPAGPGRGHWRDYARPAVQPRRRFSTGVNTPRTL